MSTSIHGGPFIWGGSRNAEGQRTFNVSHKIHATSVADGPQTVLNTPGLPIIGSPWNYGNDFDAWAFCTPQMGISIYQPKEGHPNHWWKVTNTFSTAPQNRCQDESIEDPLLEPD